MCPVYNEPEAVIGKDDDEGPNNGSREVGQDSRADVRSALGWTVQKRLWGTRGDAVSTAWSSNAKKNFATRVLVLESVIRVSGRGWGNAGGMLFAS